MPGSVWRLLPQLRLQQELHLKPHRNNSTAGSGHIKVPLSPRRSRPAQKSSHSRPPSNQRTPMSAGVRQGERDRSSMAHGLSL